MVLKLSSLISSTRCSSQYAWQLGKHCVSTVTWLLSYLGTVHTGLDLPPTVLILLDWIILQLPKHHGKSLVERCFTPCGASSEVSPLDLSCFRSAASADLWSAHRLSSLWSQLRLFFPSCLQFELILLARASPTIIWPTMVVSENSVFAVIYLKKKKFALNCTHSLMAKLC